MLPENMPGQRERLSNKHLKQSQAFYGSAIGCAACTCVVCLRSLNADPLDGLSFPIAM